MSTNRVLLRKGTTIELYNIYFDFDKYNLREDGTEELQWVRRILLEYPTMKVEISAHTDSRAPDSYNITLSQNRANSVRSYLIKEGIEGSRIVSKGYGEKKLKNDCKDGVECSEIEHQRNRRVEFTVISFEGEAAVSKEWKVYKR
jgi:outer membrane protein OmpA-like peptidoglycan-associated protein